MIETIETTIWWNGARAQGPSPLSRGLHYGDGVFRTMLVQNAVIVNHDAQLARLAADAEAISLEVPVGIHEDIAEAITGSSESVLKVMLMRCGASRGYRAVSDQADRLLIRYPIPVFPRTHCTAGIAAFRSPVTMASQPRLAGIKHLNRLEQVLASRDWPDGIDEAILADHAGAPICGTRSNLFWVAGGNLHTPALDRCGVAGVTRARILTLARDRGLEVRVETQAWSSLFAADEAFICNSVIGIWPLRRLDDHDYPAPGPLTADLIKALRHPTLRDR